MALGTEDAAAAVSSATRAVRRLAAVAREAGAAQEQPLPGTPGTATFNAGALALSVPALPAHATSLRAFRKPAGGQPELAGTSTGPTVSVVGSGPLAPGVTYELWVVGHNFRGDGPESNRVSHTA